MLCGGITQSLLPLPPIPLCLGFGVQDRDVGLKRHVDEGGEDIQVTEGKAQMLEVPFMKGRHCNLPLQVLGF